MIESRRLSDDGTHRYKVKVTLIVLAVALGIVAIQLARRPPGLVMGVLLVALVLGCFALSMRSTTWFIADSVDLGGRKLTVRRGRRTVVISLEDVTDVGRGAWTTGNTVVFVLRAHVDGFGSAVTYRVAGADAVTSDELNAAVARLRHEFGLAPIVEPNNKLTPEGNSRLQLKRWALGFLLVLYLPIMTSSILGLEWFAPYERRLLAIGSLVLSVAFFFGFSPAERDAMMDRTKRTRG